MCKKLLHLAAVWLLLLTVNQIATQADTALQHQTEQPRPIKLGTSGGNINDSSTAFCCSGTLGALVEDGNFQYILSNNHVLARTNNALPGEEIIQPGLIDQTPVCYEDVDDTVAHLSDFVKIRFKKGKVVPLNQVDAAIAQVVPGAVEPNGAILCIGVVSSNTSGPAIGQTVKKSGRTTGLTTGTIGAINVTVDVGYNRKCGGAANLVARFNNQILIDTEGFSAGGDSGSLIVTDAGSEQQAVGLLFAGSSDGSLTVANPINAVLQAFGVVMAGGAPPGPKPVGSIKGTVMNSKDQSPIEGAVVTVVETGQSTTTNPDGSYLINEVQVGDYSVKASAAGFKPQTKPATVYEGQQTIVDFSLRPHKGKGKSLGQQLIKRAVRVKKRHEQNLFQIDGVAGIGVGLSDAKQPVIQIYLKEDSAEARRRIPAELDNIPVQVLVTGSFEAF